MASHVLPPPPPPMLLRGVKVFAFSGRYILGSSRCEDGYGAMFGRPAGVQTREEFPAKFLPVAVSYF